MSEANLLYSYLAIALVLAPLMTNHFFLGNSRIYRLAHFFSLGVIAVGAFSGYALLMFVWPVFCVFGVGVFVTYQHRTLEGVIPILFSLISSVWFAAGTNDLQLLGYNRDWSLYAALHGSFLGWMLFGSFAKAGYRYGTFLGLILFLCVAFGIDGVPYVKRVGVLGLAVLVPVLLTSFALNMRERKRAMIPAVVSLLSVVGTLSLAVAYEFGFNFPHMVLVHGGMNALVTVPCFVLAVFLSERK